MVDGRQLNHPYILSLMESVKVNGSIGLITKLVEGKDLNTYLFSETDKLEVRMQCLFNMQPITICQQIDDVGRRLMSVKICQALVYLHTNNPAIAHLDIKPSNIMVDMHGRLALINTFSFFYVD